MALKWLAPAIPETPSGALHSHADPDWYTPSPYVGAARLVMGAIDLDPASDAEANKIVKADVFYTKVQNGLTMPWFGRVFINAPGEQVVPFWEKLMDVGSKVEQFIWLGFSVEQLQTLQNTKSIMTPLHFPMCVPKKRIAFVENVAKRAIRLEKCIKEGTAFKEKTSPSHANYILYHGPHEDRFEYVFGGFGQVTRHTALKFKG